ncbi:putative 40s ribosomal protein s15 protein [Lasiodiplodia theobromae]|nr:putative 40s ribosomal protein s15 protein [Lasiodiplodia theobromae]
MKHLAAYLLLGLGGNTSPSAADVKAVLESVGVEADSDRLDKLIAELEGKDIQECITVKTRSFLRRMGYDCSGSGNEGLTFSALLRAHALSIAVKTLGELFGAGLGARLGAPTRIWANLAAVDTTSTATTPFATPSKSSTRTSTTAKMADQEYNAEEAAELKRKRAFRKFSYRGIDLDQLLDLSSEQLRDVVHARARRRFNRGLKRKPMGLIKKLRKAKQEAKPNEKPDLVKTHLRDMIVVPEMIGSVIGIYSGKEFNQVEIKPEMVGHYLAEFSISYKPVKHGRPGIGATHSSRFIPLK